MTVAVLQRRENKGAGGSGGGACKISATYENEMEEPVGFHAEPQGCGFFREEAG